MRIALLLILLSMAGAVNADERGRQIFEARCAACHQLPDPASLKPKQWRLVLMTMQKRMQKSGLPPLSDDEFGLVLDYLAGEAGR